MHSWYYVGLQEYKYATSVVSLHCALNGASWHHSTKGLVTWTSGNPGVFTVKLSDLVSNVPSECTLKKVLHIPEIIRVQVRCMSPRGSRFRGEGGHAIEDMDIDIVGHNDIRKRVDWHNERK